MVSPLTCSGDFLDVCNFVIKQEHVVVVALLPSEAFKKTCHDLLFPTGTLEVLGLYMYVASKDLAYFEAKSR